MDKPEIKHVSGTLEIPEMKPMADEVMGRIRSWLKRVSMSPEDTPLEAHNRQLRDIMGDERWSLEPVGDGGYRPVLKLDAPMQVVSITCGPITVK